MIITRLEQPERLKTTVGRTNNRSKKIRVYIDEEYSFSLYSSDIREYGLEEGMELPEEVHRELIWEVVFPRAKQKALSLLKFSDRTEAELSHRLCEDGFPPMILQKLIDYLYEYGYLNDERYAYNYIRHRKSAKSRMVLSAELTAKGIRKELIKQAFAAEYEEQEEDPEITAIRKAIRKKTQDASALSREEKQKLMAYLYRKGFSTEKICKVLEEEAAE